MEITLKGNRKAPYGVKVTFSKMTADELKKLEEDLGQKAVKGKITVIYDVEADVNSFGWRLIPREIERVEELIMPDGRTITFSNQI